jgi:hypothetical protein
VGEALAARGRRRQRRAIRQLFEPGDLGEDLAHRQPEGREQRAQAAAQQQ